jgi:hypothetical protein
LRKSFDVNRNMLSAASPAMSEFSQIEAAAQGRKYPVMLSGKVRATLRLKHYSLRTKSDGLLTVGTGASIGGTSSTSP